MTALTLTMTTAGLGRFTAAQASDDIDLTIATVGLTASAFVVAPTLTALPGEFRRIATIAGSAIGDNLVHMIVRDEAALAYDVRGFGLFLQDGTLFAVYGQATPIAGKSVASTLLLALDIAFPTSDITQLTFGDTNFLNPIATSETKGVVELATLPEAEAGDTTRATTGAVVKAMIATAIDAVGEAIDGLIRRTIYGAGLVKGGGDGSANRTLTVDAATAAQLRAGVASDAAATPAGLAAAGFAYVVRSNLVSQGGYREWSDGYIEQWGFVDGNITNEQAYQIAFPIPFVAECFGIRGTARNTSQSASGSHQVQEVSVALTGAVVFLQSDQSTTSDAAGGFRWRATGR